MADNTPEKATGAHPTHSVQHFDAFFENCATHGLAYIHQKNFPKQKVAREVIRIGPRNHHVGLFASRVNQKLVPFESGLEKDACSYFESISEVIKYTSQPQCVHLNYAGGEHIVYPDFALVTPHRTVLVDVRHAQSASTTRYRARCAALQTYAEHRGMNYALLTEREIRGQRLFNARALLSYCHGVPEQRLVDSVWGWLPCRSTAPLPTVFKELRAYPAAVTTLAGLILDGHLTIDWDRPLGEQTVSLDEPTRGTVA